MRLPAVVAGLLVLTAGCAANEAPPPVPVQAGGELVTHVPDSLFDAGRGASVALDQDGNPVVIYVLLTPTLKEDELPPPVLPGDPQPPAIMIAALGEGAWTRTSVTEQSTNPAEGRAVGISDEEGRAGPDVNTSLAIDEQGNHHVAWSSTEGVFYATDAGGQFGEPEQIGSGTTTGVSLALGSGGEPWISFYQAGELRVAHEQGGDWAVEPVATVGAEGDEASVTSAMAVTPDGDPVVGFGDEDGTVVAIRRGGEWTPERVPGPGGFGVSLELDQDGNPHVAYYERSGRAFHAHAVGGGPWEVTDLALTASRPPAEWGTGIALDEAGVHYIVVAGTDAGIELLTNEGGSFQAQPVPNSEFGATPSIDVSGDGEDVAIAFFDTENADLEVAVAPEEGLNLAFSPPPTAETPTAEPPPTEAPCQPDGTTLEISAVNIAFDTDCLAAPADAAFEILFNNEEPPGVLHNVHLYSDSSAADSLGGAEDATDLIDGGESTTYQVDPIESGIYYFHCDVHPTMNGTFVSA